MENHSWKDVRLSILGNEIEFKPLVYKNDTAAVFETPIEIKIDELKKISGVIMHERISSENGRSIKINDIEFKVGNIVEFNNNEYLVYAVLEDRIILELISIKYE